MKNLILILFLLIFSGNTVTPSYAQDFKCHEAWRKDWKRYKKDSKIRKKLFRDRRHKASKKGHKAVRKSYKSGKKEYEHDYDGF